MGPLSLFVVRDRSRVVSAGGERRFDPRGAYAEIFGSLRHADRTFWLVTVAFFLGLAATFAMLFHQVAYLQDLGFPPAGVAAAVGISGLVSLLARFVFPALGDRVGPPLLVAGVLLTLAASALAVFGVAFGAVLPMRGLQYAVLALAVPPILMVEKGIE